MTNSDKDKFLTAGLIAVIVFALVVVWNVKAGAHTAEMGWSYDPWCCNGNSDHGDCQEIPSTSVKPVQGGFVVSLAPGDHRKITKAHVYTVPQDKVKYSPDGHYHLCLYPTEDDVRCFYAPPSGS